MVTCCLYFCKECIYYLLQSIFLAFNFRYDKLFKRSICLMLFSSNLLLNKVSCLNLCCTQCLLIDESFLAIVLRFRNLPFSLRPPLSSRSFPFFYITCIALSLYFLFIRGTASVRFFIFIITIPI